MGQSAAQLPQCVQVSLTRGFTLDVYKRQIPGRSEHQLGLAVDINGGTYEIYTWLQENSYKYGFIFRYPGGKSHLTGTAEEVWHYRYVGVEAATEMYEQDICLEEYLADSTNAAA